MRGAIRSRQSGRRFRYRSLSLRGSRSAPLRDLRMSPSGINSSRTSPFSLSYLALRRWETMEPCTRRPPTHLISEVGTALPRWIRRSWSLRTHPACSALFRIWRSSRAPASSQVPAGDSPGGAERSCYPPTRPRAKAAKPTGSFTERFASTANKGASSRTGTPAAAGGRGISVGHLLPV